MTRKGRGFALLELATVIVLIGLLAAVLVALGAEQRRNGRLVECTSNLKRLGAGMAVFASDREDEIATFYWQGGETQEVCNQGPTMLGDDLDAAAWQAVDILRCFAGREDIDFINGWIPHVFYSQLPLAQHMGWELPSKTFVCPADTNRLNWQDDPEGKFDQGFWLPLQPNPTDSNKRWPYSASYQLVPAGWDLNQSEPGDGVTRVSQGFGWDSYSIPNDASFGPSLVSDVAHPAGKVEHMESHQRHFGDARQPLFGLEEARIPLLMFDGSVSVRATADANPGWRPESPTDPCPSEFFYNPGNSPWFPPAIGIDGPGLDIVTGFYRWTRLGLKGIDFGGAEPDTGQGDAGCN